MTTPLPRLILAPLLGVTTAAFRRVFAQYYPGFDCAMAPFLSVTHGKLPPRKYFKDILPENNQKSLPLIPQLIGKDGADFRDMANRIAEEFGYEEINWNIGCPSPTVTSRLRGAGLLANPTMIADFLSQAFSGLRCSISVKMRLGMHKSDEYLALVDILNDYAIKEITIHPRTGIQKYSGKADVEAFADLQARLKHPIVYNGDLNQPDQVATIAGRFPHLTGIMLGRGAVRDPRLPNMAKLSQSQEAATGLEGLSQFHWALYEEYRRTMEGGAGPILGKMKEVWTYWPDRLGESAIRLVLKCKSLAEYEDQAEAAFSQALAV